MCTRAKCNIKKETKVFLLRTFLSIFYMYGGALLFMAIEQEPAKKESDDIIRKIEILKKNATTKLNVTEKQFMELVKTLKPLYCSSMPKWSFEEAISFTMQLLTTIGYGNISPRTTTGKMITIVYALFGIPLILLTLKSCGSGYNSLLKWLLTIFEKCVRKNTEISHTESKILLLNFFALAVVILLSATQSISEDRWNMWQGIYVWFITFTTVGFGDFIPASMTSVFQPNGYLVAGLCLMSAVVDALVVWVERLDRCHRNCCRSQENIDVEDDHIRRNSFNNLGFENSNRQREDDKSQSQETTF